MSSTEKPKTDATITVARQSFGFRQDSAAPPPPSVGDNHVSGIIPVVLLAALSILAVSVIYEAPAAFADHDPVTEVWSATLTVGELEPYRGYVGGASIGTLSDNNPTYDGATYQISQIRIHKSSGQLELILDQAIPDSAKSALSLHIGNAQFRLADASLSSFGSVANSRAIWTNPGLSWNTGDTVQVRLTASPSQTLHASISGNPREGANLWSATMTTYDLGTTGPATRGCDDSQAGARCISALSDNDFTFDGIAYTVKAISYKSGTYPESLKLTLDKTIPENLISCLTLHAGNAQIRLVGDAVVGAGVDAALSASNGVADSTLTLTEISGVGFGLNWSAGGTAQLRLPDIACLTLTLNEPVDRETSIQRVLGGTASHDRTSDPDYPYIKLPTFAAGSTTAMTPIRVIDDNRVEGCETMTWRMTMWPGTPQALRLFYTIYIEDNDGGDSCPAVVRSSAAAVPESAQPPVITQAVPESAQLPVITLAGSTNMTVPLNSAWTDPGYTATDSDGNDLTASVTVTGAVDTTQEATYLLYYQVADSSGTPATPQIRTVHVVAPELQQQTQEPQGEPQQEAEQGAEQEPTQEPEQEPTQEPQQEPEQEPTQEPEPEPESSLPAIVQQYDTDGSGVIEQDEWLVAVDDYTNYELTTPEIQQIAAHRG